MDFGVLLSELCILYVKFLVYFLVNCTVTLALSINQKSLSEIVRHILANLFIFFDLTFLQCKCMCISEYDIPQRVER